MLGNKSLSEITDIFIGPMDVEKKKSFMASCNNTCDQILHRDDWHETLYPQVKEAIETLTTQGAALGVFTGTRHDAMENQLNYHGLSAIFAARYRQAKDNIRDADKTSDALKADQLLAIANQFKKDKGTDDVCIIVVGDSSADAEAAKALGLLFVGFAQNANKKKLLQQAGVGTIIDSFVGLPALIDTLCRSRRPTPAIRFDRKRA